MAPKQKIRIKLRSYWVPLIEDSCKQIMDAARTTNAKTMGPVPLPTKKRIYCVLKSPHVHKDARFHFEIRTHQRLIDILYPTAQTIDSLMQLDLPAGVDVEVKLWWNCCSIITIFFKFPSNFVSGLYQNVDENLKYFKLFWINWYCSYMHGRTLTTNWNGSEELDPLCWLILCVMPTFPCAISHLSYTR